MTWQHLAVVCVVVFTAAALLANSILLWHTNRLVDRYEALTHKEDGSDA